MQIPFTVEQFLEVFENYNTAIWPMQVVVYALALIALTAAATTSRYGSRLTSAVLGFFWIWMGAAYHLLHFSPINKAAYVFGGMFIVQGFVFLHVGVLGSALSFRCRMDSYCAVGTLFVLYAMVFYPIIGHLVGHGYPQSPCFGVAPCPTTIFTFGLLLCTDRRVPKPVLAIPFLWSIIGFTAAIKLGVLEDVGLLVAGVGGSALLFVRDRSLPRAGVGVGNSASHTDSRADG